MSRLVVDVSWLGLVESFLGRARNKLDEAEYHMKEGHYPESVSASQECIEFSAKSICKILTGDYPREHWF
jgi:HEPN domain-containing protein